MEAILALIAAQEPLVSEDLRSILADPDIARVAACLTSPTPTVVEISEYIPKMGYGGDQKQQRQRVKYIIQRGDFPCHTVKAREVVGATSIRGLHILNPLGPTRKNAAHMAIFMTPLDLLCLFASVKTPQAMSYKRAIWALFAASREETESAVIAPTTAAPDIEQVANCLGEWATTDVPNVPTPLLIMRKGTYITPIRRTAEGLGARRREMERMGFSAIKHATPPADARSLWSKLTAVLQQKKAVTYTLFTDRVTGKNVRVYQFTAHMDLPDIIVKMGVSDCATDRQWVTDVVALHPFLPSTED